MDRRLITGLGLMLLAACGKRDQGQASADSLARDLQLAAAESTTAVNDQPAPGAAPAPAPAVAPAPAKPKPKPATPAPAAQPIARSLASGVVVTASANDSLHSRHNKAGEAFNATVGENVRDAKGNIVIPSGSVVRFRITKIQHANNKSDPDGELRLQAEQVTIGGQSYPIAGTANENTIQHTLVGQGVTAGAAARVGGGAAAGAIAGKVIGGKTGAIIGGVVGGAGGAVAANQTADRDVVVSPGNTLTFTLTSEFTIAK